MYIEIKIDRGIGVSITQNSSPIQKIEKRLALPVQGTGSSCWHDWEGAFKTLEVQNSFYPT